VRRDSCNDPALLRLDLYPASRLTKAFVEFRTFVERTEKELLSLFESIDRDHNGKLDKSELQLAFKKAGLIVPKAKLNEFFAEVDENHDVRVSYPFALPIRPLLISSRDT